MNLAELLTQRRSIRKFQAKAVPRELIESIIHDSILAPSAGNEQPWKFILVLNPELNDRISLECKKNMLHRFASNPGDPARKYEQMLRIIE